MHLLNLCDKNNTALFFSTIAFTQRHKNYARLPKLNQGIMTYLIRFNIFHFTGEHHRQGKNRYNERPLEDWILPPSN